VRLVQPRERKLPLEGENEKKREDAAGERAPQGATGARLAAGIHLGPHYTD